MENKKKIFTSHCMLPFLLGLLQLSTNSKFLLSLLTFRMVLSSFYQRKKRAFIVAVHLFVCLSYFPSLTAISSTPFITISLIVIFSPHFKYTHFVGWKNYKKDPAERDVGDAFSGAST